MDETKQTAETGSEEGGDQRQQQIVDMGSSTIRTERGDHPHPDHCRTDRGPPGSALLGQDHQI